MSKYVDKEVIGLEILSFCIERSNLDKKEAQECFLSLPLPVKRQAFKDLKDINLNIREYINVLYGNKIN